MNSTLKKLLKRYNGWLGFVVGTILFFVAPTFYRILDPTAGQFDAGYIHPIIYALIVVSFASAFAWLLLQLMAPGQFKKVDEWFESDYCTIPDNVKWLLKLYLFLAAAIIVVICAIV